MQFLLRNQAVQAAEHRPNPLQQPRPTVREPVIEVETMSRYGPQVCCRAQALRAGTPLRAALCEGEGGQALTLGSPLRAALCEFVSVSCRAKLSVWQVCLCLYGMRAKRAADR